MKVTVSHKGDGALKPQQAVIKMADEGFDEDSRRWFKEDLIMIFGTHWGVADDLVEVTFSDE